MNVVHPAGGACGTRAKQAADSKSQVPDFLQRYSRVKTETFQLTVKRARRCGLRSVFGSEENLF